MVNQVLLADMLKELWMLLVSDLLVLPSVVAELVTITQVQVTMAEPLVLDLMCLQVEATEQIDRISIPAELVGQAQAVT